MSYDSYIGRRQARIVTLLERNPSVRRFIETLPGRLADLQARHGARRVLLEDPVVVNYTGDEELRARILRG